jgi:hypothetical protein
MWIEARFLMNGWVAGYLIICSDPYATQPLSRMTRFFTITGVAIDLNIEIHSS